MQGVIIQGPTTYYKDILQSYTNLPNVVFSTWEDEPKENIEQIKSHNIEVVQSPKPHFSGYLNVNLQTTSTYAGIAFLKSKGITEALKIRSDLNVNKVSLLLEFLKGGNLSFLSICKPNVRPLYYQLEYLHTSFDFPSDLILYGNIESLEKCFNFQVEENYSIPPESLIAYSFLTQSSLDFNLSYEYFVNNGISFFAQECLDNDVQIDWLKRSKEEPLWKNILNHSGDRNFYEY